MKVMLNAVSIYKINNSINKSFFTFKNKLLVYDNDGVIPS